MQTLLLDTLSSWGSESRSNSIQSFIDSKNPVTIKPDMMKDVETADAGLTCPLQRQLLWQVTAEEVFGRKVNAGTSRFSPDLRTDGPFVWMGTIIDRPVIERLGNVVRVGINQL